MQDPPPLTKYQKEFQYYQLSHKRNAYRSASKKRQIRVDLVGAPGKYCAGPATAANIEPRGYGACARKRSRRIWVASTSTSTCCGRLPRLVTTTP